MKRRASAPSQFATSKARQLLAGLSLACGVTGLHPAIGPGKHLALRKALVADR
jgi:hypothetical protein